MRHSVRHQSVGGLTFGKWIGSFENICSRPNLRIVDRIKGKL
jgi:hypothetical protein